MAKAAKRNLVLVLGAGAFVLMFAVGRFIGGGDDAQTARTPVHSHDSADLSFAERMEAEWIGSPHLPVELPPAEAAKRSIQSSPTLTAELGPPLSIDVDGTKFVKHSELPSGNEGRTYDLRVHGLKASLLLKVTVTSNSKAPSTWRAETLSWKSDGDQYEVRVNDDGTAESTSTIHP